MAAVSQLRPRTVYVGRSDAGPPSTAAHSTLTSTSHTAAARADATATTSNRELGLGAGVHVDKQASKATPNSTQGDTLGASSCSARTSSKVPTTVARPGGALRRPQRVVPAATQTSNSGGHNGSTAQTPSTPGRARRTVKPAPAADENQNEHFKLPSLAKSTTRTPSRVQRRLSQTSSSTAGSRDFSATTVRPDRRIGSPSASRAGSSATPRRKADALATPSSSSALAASTSSSFLSDSVRASTRSVNALNASTRTPLRASTSTSRSRTPSTGLSGSTRVRPTPAVPREANSRTAIPATAVRKKPGTQSAIPVPTTVRNEGRTVSRPTSSAGTAALASFSAARSRSVSSGRRQEQQAGLGIGGPGRRPSGPSALRASQSSRKSSWETVRSARNSLASSRRRSSIVRPGLEEEEQMKTPRRPSAAVGPATLVSPPSPAQESLPTGLEGQISPTSDPTELFISHAAFLSPLPPPPHSVDLLLPSQGQGSKTRSRPRESTSLEEILRLGMLNQSLARRADGPSLELELLLDEGTSRVMTDELRNSLGGGGGGAGCGAGQGGRDSPAGANTPWRGRVVSLGASAKRRSFASSAAVSGLDPLAEDGSSSHVSSSSSPPKQNGQVLLLRQSTAEASDLRRQVAALSAELERLKAQQQTETTSLVADRQLLDELEAARRREVELRADWEAERQAMEEDMAELAAAASSSTRELTPPPPPPLAVAPVPNQQVDPSERLYERAEIYTGASARLAATYSEMEALAKREREDGRLAIASLQAIARGLEVWGTVLE